MNIENNRINNFDFTYTPTRLYSIAHGKFVKK